MMGISKSTCHAILCEDLGKSKPNTRLVSCILTDGKGGLLTDLFQSAGNWS